MTARCGGTSSEFVVNSMIRGTRNPNQLILAAHPEGEPSRLAGWVFVIFVEDTYQPWAEVWGLWCEPRAFKTLMPMANEAVVQWAKAKGAKRLMAIATRSPRVQHERFYGPAG